MTLRSLDLKYYRRMEKDYTFRRHVGAKKRRKLRILQMCNWRCNKCGRRSGLTIDHKQQHGNRQHKELYLKKECVVICRKCHEKKNKK